MAEQPAAPQPVIVQRGGGITAIAGDAIDALKTSPVLLLIVLLNMAFAGAASYYLERQEERRGEGISALISLLDKCTMHTVPIEALPYILKKPTE
jgi:hypothetical protein